MGTSFKENLREMLDYHDMTVKELSYITRISKRSIENYLNARSSMPPADYACKIAAALHTTVEDLVNGTSLKKSPPACDATVLRFMEHFKHLDSADQNALMQLVQSLHK